MGPYDDVPHFIREEGVKTAKNWKKYAPKEKWGTIDESMEIFTPENIANIALGYPPSDQRYTFLSNIVSGTFDVDRMDYLRRDALFTGIETGNIDIWEIIQGYTLAKIDNDKWNAVLSTDTALAVEILLNIRDLVYRQVYYHKTHRSAQEMLIRAMYDLIDRYPLEDLVVMTDEELLKAFEGNQGTALTKEIASRIRYRAIYEPLPININVSEDLDEIAQERWSEMVFAVPNSDNFMREWLDAEKSLCKQIGLPHEQTIIFDLRAVPITRKDEYDSLNFYDEIKKKRCSLIELEPHLRLTRGTREILIDGKRVNSELTQLYLKEISNLLITLPFEYINKIIEDCKDEIEVKTREVVDKQPLIDSIIESKLDPMMIIIQNLVQDFLKLADQEKRDKINAKFRLNTNHYLHEILIDRGII